VLAAYNVVFTAYPIIMWGFFEKDVNENTSLIFPQIYKPGQTNEFLNYMVFAYWTLEALWHAFITFFFSYYFIAMHEDSTGRQLSLWDAGNATYTCVLLVVTFRLILDTRHYTWPHHIAYWGSLFLWFFFIMVYSTMDTMSPDMYNSYPTLLGSSIFWVSTPITVTICLLPTMVQHAWSRIMAASHSDVLRNPRSKNTCADTTVGKAVQPGTDSYFNMVYELRQIQSDEGLRKVGLKGRTLSKLLDPDMVVEEPSDVKSLEQPASERDDAPLGIQNSDTDSTMDLGPTPSAFQKAGTNMMLLSRTNSMLKRAQSNSYADSMSINKDEVANVTTPRTPMRKSEYAMRRSKSTLARQGLSEEDMASALGVGAALNVEITTFENSPVTTPKVSEGGTLSENSQ